MSTAARATATSPTPTRPPTAVQTPRPGRRRGIRAKIVGVAGLLMVGILVVAGPAAAGTALGPQRLSSRYASASSRSE